MRNLKEYITENNFFKNLGVGLQPQIKEWLDKNGIVNYTINNDLTIDVKGDVYLYRYPETELPEYIQFKNVSGDFIIEYSNLTSLKGCPKEVGGDFYCCRCNKKFTQIDVQNNCTVRGKIVIFSNLIPKRYE